MNYQKLLNKNIKKLRQKNNLTQEAFAEKIGVSIQGLSNLERNRYQPNAKTIDRICKIFDIKPQELLIDETTEKNEILANINTLLNTCPKNKLQKIYEIINIMTKL